MHFVVSAKALRKVFVSIKGIYYQAEIQGQTVTWVVPHAVPSHQPADVDFKIMLTFAEFYVTMLGFVNFNLYSQINLNYPPKVCSHIRCGPFFSCGYLTTFPRVYELPNCKARFYRSLLTEYMMLLVEEDRCIWLERNDSQCQRVVKSCALFADLL